MGTASHHRSSHANLDVAARRRKAQKIKLLLESCVDLDGARILEIGTGAGVIAAELVRLVGPRGELWTVDVVDERQIESAARFVRVDGTTLPFDGDSFDLVISNHVIEHVGDAQAQSHHVAELRRVLKPGGWAYLAMPNRWAPVEPHFKLPLLSWLPLRWRSSYVRLTRRGRDYDCRPLSRGELLSLFERHQFRAIDRTFDALDIMRTVDPPGGPVRQFLRLPSGLLRTAHPIMPTFIFLIQHNPSARIP